MEVLIEDEDMNGMLLGGRARAKATPSRCPSGRIARASC